MSSACCRGWVLQTSAEPVDPEPSMLRRNVYNERPPNPLRCEESFVPFWFIQLRGVPVAYPWRTVAYPWRRTSLRHQ